MAASPATPHMPLSRWVALVVVAVLLVAGGAYGAYLWHYSTTHISTDDAYINGHIAPVSTRVSGIVVDVRIEDNQDVKAGDVLVRLDPRDYDVALAQARAAVAAAQGDLRNALTNVPLTDESTLSLMHEADAALAAVRHGEEINTHDLEQRRSELRGKQAAVAVAVAAVEAAQADFEKARLDRDRTAELLRTQLVARQDFDHAEAAFKNAQANLEMARHKLAQARQDVQQATAAVESQGAALAQARRRIDAARATLANAQSQRQQVKVRETVADAARGRLAMALANLQQADLNLSYTTIRAPITGRVTRKAVEVGQVLQPAQPFLSVVDLNDIWVVANYKETQLTTVRPGQRAVVTIDTYPGVSFKARVDSVQGGSGAVFSLLPPENATGNFVKVVQRIPVKLVLEPGQNSHHLLVPGMSVVPTIELRSGR